MRTDLTDIQTQADADNRTVTGADGEVYARRTTRMARRQADELIAAGTPLVFERYGDALFDWCDGADAASVWASERTYVITSEPTAKQLAKHAMWTAGLWESGDGARLVYLSGRC
ncbi:hypothetical protein GCM10022237_38760 [Nocardioides ginsengisoli]|uniref:Uncharacterized protein n=1 Tax=Nocardioides ginsengisoli TaxID=363868 RepID=A0ABW3VY46_9ACTN